MFFLLRFFVVLLVYRILGSKTKNTVYSSFLSLTVEKTISYYYLLSLLVPIISYYSFFGGDRLLTGGGGYQTAEGRSKQALRPRPRGEPHAITKLLACLNLTVNGYDG